MSLGFNLFFINAFGAGDSSLGFSCAAADVDDRWDAALVVDLDKSLDDEPSEESGPTERPDSAVTDGEVSEPSPAPDDESDSDAYYDYPSGDLTCCTNPANLP